MSSQSRFLIYAVEDDPVFSKMLEYLLTLDSEHELKMFKTGAEMLDYLSHNPSLITLDYRLPDLSGAELLKRIRYAQPETPVIVISGQEEVKTAVNLLKEGAYDYITKDEDIRERLLNSINNAKRSVMLSREVESLREELSHKYDFSKTIIGTSKPVTQVFKMLEKAVKTNITLSITGETGTGKEVVAKATHFNSTRKKHPFVAVNIAAIPDTLLESELFGHEKGAFTGAITRRVGKFEEANKGTIFLDEIGEMDMSLQAKLLRVLQEREIERIGGNTRVKLDVRVITATNKDLTKLVKEGKFREDLYYRLMGMPIHLPPLRERGSDILLISRHFIDLFCKENDIPNVSLTQDAIDKLMSYSYPGNIRELKAIVELATVMCADGKITAEDINFNSLGEENTLFKTEKTLREYIFDIVRTFLKKYDDNVMLVASKLDIGKSTIYRYLQEMKEESEGNNRIDSEL